MLFANRCTWAHILTEVADLLNAPPSDLLQPAELEAVLGVGDPRVLRA